MLVNYTLVSVPSQESERSCVLS